MQRWDCICGHGLKVLSQENEHLLISSNLPIWFKLAQDIHGFGIH